MKTPTNTMKNLSQKVSILSGVIAFTAMQSAQATVLITEDFGGDVADDLHGTLADTFDAGITTAGGSSTWAARDRWKADGSMAIGGSNAAYLNMGTYINGFKGDADGLFTLTMDISEVSGGWISLGFSGITNPTLGSTFVAASVKSTGTIIYRDDLNELDMFGGLATANAVDGPNSNSGTRTLSVSLDLTTHNDVDDFGSVTWSDSVLGNLGSYAFDASNDDFASIYISSSNGLGTIDNLTFTSIAVPEPSSAALVGLAGFALILRRRR